MGFPCLPPAWVTRPCVAFCIQAICPAWAFPQSYKCSCAKMIRIVFCFLYEHSLALYFSLIFFAMSELKTVSASACRLGRQHPSGNHRLYTQTYSVFTYFQPFLWNRYHIGCFKTANRPALPPHLPWLLAIKKPFVYKLFAV